MYASDEFDIWWHKFRVVNKVVSIDKDKVNIMNDFFNRRNMWKSRLNVIIGVIGLKIHVKVMK